MLQGTNLFRFLLLWVLLALHTLAIAQQQDEFDYKDEYNFGITTNTNASLIGGFMFKYGWQARKNQYNAIHFEAVNLTHPKENNVINQLTNNSFTPFKLNYVFVLRPSFNREFVLFRKGAEEGVQVNFMAGTGLAAALVKPYYILYDEVNPRPNPNFAKSVPYNPARHDIGYIFGRGNILEGLDQTKIKLGLNLRAALSFEFGRFNSNVIGVQTGFNLDYFTEPLPMMAGNNDNYAFWPSIFLTLYYGNKN